MSPGKTDGAKENQRRPCRTFLDLYSDYHQDLYSEMAITAAHDSYVVIYSVATGEIIQEFKLNSPCYTAKFNNDGC